MFKLVALLAAGMFVTLLIGGEDKGQMRQGLVGVAQSPVERPVVRQVKTEAPADVALASFSPVTVQKTVAAPSSTIAGSFVVSQDKVDAVAEVANAAPEVSNDLPIMYVSSRSVNVRGGPSTDFEIVGRLTRAEAVTVVEPETDGWVQIRIEGDGVEGYIAARLLSDTDPAGN